MKRLFLISFTLLFVLVGCKNEKNNKTEQLPSTGQTTQKEEETVNNPELYFEHDFTYLFIEDRIYKENPNYYALSNFNLFTNIFKNKKGLIDVSIEAMYLKERDEFFRFIEFDLDETIMSLNIKDDTSYQISLQSTKPIIVYNYIGNKIAKATGIGKNKDGTYNYELYTVNKEVLESSYNNAFILYNLKSEIVGIKNNIHETISFRDVFSWKMNEIISLNEFESSYIIKKGDRYDHGFFQQLNRG